MQLLEALLNESSERRAALEARQAARAAQLLARQEQMAAAAQARREERLQLMGRLAPAPKPVTHKEELEQLRKYGHTSSSIVPHKHLDAAQIGLNTLCCVSVCRLAHIFQHVFLLGWKL